MSRSQSDREGKRRQAESSRQRKWQVQRSRGGVSLVCWMGCKGAQIGRSGERCRGGGGLDWVLCGQHWGAMEGFTVREGSSALLLWTGSPDLISVTPKLMFLPAASTGTKEPPSGPL